MLAALAVALTACGGASEQKQQQSPAPAMTAHSPAMTGHAPTTTSTSPGTTG